MEALLNFWKWYLNLFSNTDIKVVLAAWGATIATLSFLITVIIKPAISIIRKLKSPADKIKPVLVFQTNKDHGGYYDLINTGSIPVVNIFVALQKKNGVIPQRRFSSLKVDAHIDKVLEGADKIFAQYQTADGLSYITIMAGNHIYISDSSLKKIPSKYKNDVLQFIGKINNDSKSFKAEHQA